MLQRLEATRSRGIHIDTRDHIYAGVFISNADGSLVLATYGIISSELGSLANASWIVVTYSLTMCAVQSMVCDVGVRVAGRSSIIDHVHG